jgi:hypothetical protein
MRAEGPRVPIACEDCVDNLRKEAVAHGSYANMTVPVVLADAAC